MARILCIEPDAGAREALARLLADLRHEAVQATTLEEGIELLAGSEFELIVAAHEGRSTGGLGALDALRDLGFRVPVVLTSEYSSVEHAVLSLRQGATDYLTKPFRSESVRMAVTHALELGRLRRVHESLRRELGLSKDDRTIVGASDALGQALELAYRVAPARTTVLLEGESGTGKELIARLVHERSPRAREAFVTVNCAALPEGLVESTLFGHERGAFTGATARARGAFERAHQGTLLLDEISEMRLDLQGKLLRAIQEQEFERLGGSQPVRVDVRLIATTNRNLRDEVEAGRFRRDLYYRLNVFPIRMPSLRERLEDLPALVAHFVDRAARQLGIRAPDVDPAALEALCAREWPGNVRELANVVERAVIIRRSGRLGPEDFEPARITETHPLVAEEASLDPLPSIFNLRTLERLTIERVLAATNGHRRRAARLLGISDRTLRNKLKGLRAIPNRTVQHT